MKIDNKENILLILPSNLGTMAIRGFDLYQSLINKGMNVMVAILNPKKQEGLPFKNEYVYTHTTNFIFRMIFRVIWLRNLKKKVHPVVSISVLNGCSVVSILSGGKDFKIGQFRAPVEEEENCIKKYGDRLAFLFLYYKLDKIYCVSNGIKNSIIKNFPKYNSSKIETVHNLFDFEKIQNLGQESLYMEVFNTYKIIIHIGYFHPNKGQERLIRAYSKLDDRLKKQSKLVFIGETRINNSPPNYFPNLVSLAKLNNIDNNIIFLGHQKNPYKYLQKATLCVLSSYKEGLPGVLIESLILNVPVITTNSSLGVWEAMSVEDKYDKNLDTNFNTPSGIITSNLADYNHASEAEDQDIENMCNALKNLLKDETLSFDFTCISKFKSENIIEKYINPLQPIGK